MLVYFLPVHSFLRSFFPSFVRLLVRLFVYLFVVCFLLRDIHVGNATARVRRNRIYEATGGKGQKVSRKEGRRRSQGCLGPKRVKPRRPCGGQESRQDVPGNQKCSPGGPMRQKSSLRGPRSSESSPGGPSTLIYVPLCQLGPVPAEVRVKTMP